MTSTLFHNTVNSPNINLRNFIMAKFIERIEMAHKIGIELNISRIDKAITDNNQPITIVKTMGQPCLVRKDLAEISAPYGSDLRFYEIIRINNYANLITNGKSEPVGVPMYWLGNTKTGVFKMQPMLNYFSPNQAFSEMRQHLSERTQRVSASYARDVLNRHDLIKTSLYLAGTSEYTDANNQFLSIYKQQKTK